MKYLICLIMTVGATSAWASTHSKAAPAPKKDELLIAIDGKIYPQEDFPENCKTILKGGACAEQSYGKYHGEVKKEGELNHNSGAFSDTDGPQVIENSWEKEGHVKRATIENRALKKLFELEVKDNKVFYKTTDLEDHSVKTSTDDLDENLVVPSTILPYLRPHLKDIVNGKEVILRIAVLDRQEAFTFTMKKIRTETALNGDTVAVLQMRPNSLIVRALVSPMYFYMKPDSGEMFAYEGESALRRKIDGKYKKMSVRTAYEYPVNVYRGKAQAAKINSDCDPAQVIFRKSAVKCEVKAHE